MEGTLNKIRNNIHYIVYAAFLVLQAVSHRYLVLFGDDFYYANFIPQGWDYFVKENIFHYTDTNGRFFVHLLDELLLGFDMIFWKIFNLAVIALIVLFAAKIAAGTYKYGYKTSTFKVALIFSCVLFAAISREVYTNCIYWATGAMNYLFPVSLVLIYFYYAQKDLEHNAGYAWMPVLAFFASFTTEQSSAASFAISLYVIFMCLYKHRRRPRAAYYISLVLSGAALFSVVFAPGNDVRMTYYPEFYAKSIFGRIMQDLEYFSMQVFGKNGAMLWFVILSLYCVVRVLKNVKGIKGKIFAALLFAFTAIYVVCANTVGASKTVYLCIAFVFIPLLVYFIIKLKELFALKDDESAFFFALAAALQAVMLISPEFGWRTLLVSVILLFVPALKCILWAAELMKKHAGDFLAVALAVAITLSFSNSVTIIKGYKENYPVHVYNETLMEDYVSGKTDGQPKLAYLVNGVYKYVMPYENSYHMFRYVTMWGLPGDTVIQFENYPG